MPQRCLAKKKCKGKMFNSRASHVGRLKNKVDYLYSHLEAESRARNRKDGFHLHTVYAHSGVVYGYGVEGSLFLACRRI